MTPQTGQQIITIYLPNISKSKGNSSVNNLVSFLENHAENETWRLVPDLFFCF